MGTVLRRYVNSGGVRPRSYQGGYPQSSYHPPRAVHQSQARQHTRPPPRRGSGPESIVSRSDSSRARVETRDGQCAS